MICHRVGQSGFTGIHFNISALPPTLNPLAANTHTHITGGQNQSLLTI